MCSTICCSVCARRFPTARVPACEGNSTAHLKCSYVGPSQTVLIEDGKPILGIWQGVYFCEFDGPRHRRYYIKVMADD